MVKHKSKPIMPNKNLTVLEAQEHCDQLSIKNRLNIKINYRLKKLLMVLFLLNI